MTRISKRAKTNVSLSEAQAAAHNYFNLSSQKGKLEGELNEKIQALRELYEPEITELTEGLDEPYDTLKSYAIENRKDWDNKSIELASCTIGFRLPPPSVNRQKGMTWLAIIGLMLKRKSLKDFVKVKQDIDKKEILAAQNDAKLMKELGSVGIVIEQEEEFFVDAKLEKVA